MSFVLRMVWRETRGSWTRLGFFFLCVGLGVAAIVALRSVVENVRATLTGEARTLIGADLILRAEEPLAADLRARVAREIQAAHATGTTDAVETETMASAPGGFGSGRVKLVELHGVETAFPFYGTIELAGGVPYTHALLEHHGALVQPELLEVLGLHQGDPIRLAGQDFTIRGVITRDRVQRTGFALGPRVYIDLADLRQTSLLGFGSRANYDLLVRVGADQAPALVNALEADVRGDTVSVRSWQTLEDRIGENLTIAENYLSLVGFAIVVIGGIGVWSVTRVIVQQKIRSVAILKCIGATSDRLVTIYLLEVLVLATGGSLLGLGIAAASLSAVPASVLAALGVTRVSVTGSAAFQGFAVGLLVSFLFALVPLLEIRRVKPLLLLRADTVATARRRDWQSIAASAAIGAALAVVAMWQAESVRAGLCVTGGLFVIAGLLDGASRGLVRLARPLASSSRFAVRHAVVSLGRPGNQTRVIVMTVGLGAFFILGTRAVEANLLAEFSSELGQNSPDLVVIDVQRDEVGTTTQVSAPYLRGPARVVPLLRGRVVAVQGQRLTLPTLDEVRKNARLSREFGLTFRTTLDPNERIVAGRFWSTPLTTAETADGADTEVSVERDLANGTGLSLGDLLSFDVAGAHLTARVTSVRTVAWDNAQNGGFVFVLRPGPSVDRVAHDYVGFLQVRDEATARGAVERDLVRAMPNVSVIDVHDVLASVADVVGNVTAGITVLGAVTLLGGGLILVGAVSMTKFQRLYEAAIYRALGASTRLVATLVAIEYGVLGLLAGVLAAAGGLALSWALARYLFDIDWHPTLGLFGAGIVLTAVAVSAVGLGASLDVLVRKPLGTLRGE